jgi:hypothetical protein
MLEKGMGNPKTIEKEKGMGNPKTVEKEIL